MIIVLNYHVIITYFTDSEWHSKRDADLMRLQLLKREINQEKLSNEEIKAIAAHLLKNVPQIQTRLGRNILRYF